MPTGRAMLDPTAILRRSGLSIDMHYADFGCGGIGHFVFPGAELVGPVGKVYAVDILKSALAAVEGRVREERMHNVVPVWGDMEVPGGVRIPPGTIHLVSLVNMVGLVRKSPTVLQEVRRVLVRDGRLLLIGWKPEAEKLGVPESRRIPMEEMQPIVQAAGFKRLAVIEAGEHHWGMLFAKI